jgi:hypothetical protein
LVRLPKRSEASFCLLIPGILIRFFIKKICAIINDSRAITPLMTDRLLIAFEKSDAGIFKGMIRTTNARITGTKMKAKYSNPTCHLAQFPE